MYTFTVVWSIVTVPLRQVSDVKNPALPYKLAVTFDTFAFKRVWSPIVPLVGSPGSAEPPAAPIPLSPQPSVLPPVVPFPPLKVPS